MDDIRLSPLAVWTPDVELYNSRERRLLSSELTDRVVLERSGRMVWVPPNLLTAACSLDTTWFPFDEQRCDFKFGSWTYNGFKLDLQLVRERVRCPAYLETLQKSDQVDTSSYQTNPDWELLGSSTARNEVIYECCPEPYLGSQAGSGAPLILSL